jgi:hypothetical protein
MQLRNNIITQDTSQIVLQSGFRPVFIYDIQQSNLIDVSIKEEESVGHIADFDSTYTINVINLDPFTKSIRLFGATQGIPPFPGTLVTVPKSSYEEVVAESDFNPFIIGGINLSATIDQMQAQFQIVRKAPTGVNFVRSFHPFSYFSKDQFQDSFVEIYPISLQIDGYTSIQFQLLGFSQISFQMYVYKRLRYENLLHDTPVVEVSTNIAHILEEEVVVTVL